MVVSALVPGEASGVGHHGFPIDGRFICGGSGDDGADEHLMFWVVASRTVVVDEFRWCVLRNRSELSPLLEWKLTAFLEDRDHV